MDSQTLQSKSTSCSKIGFIPQKALPFTNYRGKLKVRKVDASLMELHEATDVAQTKEFIESKEENLTPILLRAEAICLVGQKQRLSIARAIVKKPDIYIFDDSFSALDYKTDAILRSRLKVTENATVMIVAQRLEPLWMQTQIINEGGNCWTEPTMN